MRFNASEYLTYSTCMPSADKFCQIELTSTEEKIYVFVPCEFALLGSYIIFRKDKDSEWSPIFRIARIGGKADNRYLETNSGYFIIEDPDNIDFIKKQVCKSNSKGIIICQPK